MHDNAAPVVNVFPHRSIQAAREQTKVRTKQRSASKAKPASEENAASRPGKPAAAATSDSPDEDANDPAGPSADSAAKGTGTPIVAADGKLCEFLAPNK